MSSNGRQLSGRFWVLLALAIATLAKLYCAATTIGTDDAILFRVFGRVISEKGLVYLYQLSSEFNHTPLVGLWAAFAWTAGGDSPLGQPFLLRLPGIVADVVTILCLLRVRAERGAPSYLTLALLAICPVFFIVSGFHGNVDSVMVMFLTLAAAACWRGDALWCGIWLGLSANIKVVGLLLLPVLFFHFLERRAWRMFLGALTATVLAGWAFPLAVCPTRFLGNVLGYNSVWGLWGVTYWLMRSGLPGLQHVDHTNLPFAEWMVMTGLKGFVIACVFWIAWRYRRERDVWIPIAAAWACFFAFAPGGSVHYFIWPAPFLAVAVPRLSIFLLGTASIFQILCYNAAANGMPWMKATFKGFGPMFAHHAWADLAWAGFVGWAVFELIKSVRMQPKDADLDSESAADLKVGTPS
jgi:Glycosyltransferase family 87